MSAKALTNFHLPLSAELYELLRHEAETSARSATAVAREALEEWLRSRRKQRLHDAISTYARQHAGTPADLDEELEDATLSLLDREGS